MTDTLTRAQQIERIMALAGVAPRDYEAAAKNFGKLSDDEIAVRLNRLETVSVRVDNWRKTRGPAVPAPLTPRDLIEPL